jgi:hypothetical protein
MKELRSFGGPYARCSASTPSATRSCSPAATSATTRPGWYGRNIPLADDLYDEHLRLQGLD